MIPREVGFLVGPSNFRNTVGQQETRKPTDTDLSMLIVEDAWVDHFSFAALVLNHLSES